LEFLSNLVVNKTCSQHRQESASRKEWKDVHLVCYRSWNVACRQFPRLSTGFGLPRLFLNHVSEAPWVVKWTLLNRFTSIVNIQFQTLFCLISELNSNLSWFSQQMYEVKKINQKLSMNSESQKTILQGVMSYVKIYFICMVQNVC